MASPAAELPRGRALVLMYHRVAGSPTDPWSLSVSPAHFAEQLDVLTRFASPMSLAALWAHRGQAPPRGPAIAVTFDDGYADNFTTAAPLLSDAGVPATVFVTTGGVGAAREFWWDELDRLLLQPGTLPAGLTLSIGGREHRWSLGDAARYSEDEWARHLGWRAWQPPPGPRQRLYQEIWQLLHPLAPEEQYGTTDLLRVWAGAPARVRPDYRTMTPDELSALHRVPGLEIGAHTVTHPVLPRLGPAAQRWELTRSRERLEAWLGAPVTHFSYPHGQSAPETRSALRDAGFTLACTTDPQPVTTGTDALQIPRVMAEDWTGPEFRERLAGWLSAP